jgi:Phosphotransferase enzyme family
MGAVVEVVLEGGNTTAGVVRVGDTVRRPRGRRSSFSARVLEELNGVGYAWAPQYLGVDDHGRDILSFVAGETTDHPSQRDERSYRIMGQILRELHQTTRRSPLAGEEACVVHGDPGPYNVVMRDGLPVALIDWDSARPGDPLEDVGYAGWTWCVQSVGNVPVADQARRLRELVVGYDDSLSADVVVHAVELQQTRIIDAETQVLADQSFDERRRQHAKAAIQWASGDREMLRQHLDVFRAALDGGR